MKYNAMLIITRPFKRGEEQNFEAETLNLELEVADDAAARKELTIEADARQTAIRRHGDKLAQVRFVFEQAEAEEETTA